MSISIIETNNWFFNIKHWSIYKVIIRNRFSWACTWSFCSTFTWYAFSCIYCRSRRYSFSWYNRCINRNRLIISICNSVDTISCYRSIKSRSTTICLNYTFVWIWFYFLIVRIIKIICSQTVCNCIEKKHRKITQKRTISNGNIKWSFITLFSIFISRNTLLFRFNSFFSFYFLLLW